MHGRVKVKTTAEQQAAKEKERQKKLAIYRLGINTVFDKRKNGELDSEILDISAQLLLANADIYTLWNIRKETVLKIQEKDKANLETVLNQELDLTEKCLRVRPKSYGAWHHRYWVICLQEKPNWGHELALCKDCLSQDDRNFHCWDYRRLVVTKSEMTPEKELAFTTQRIEANFSNYSSWHYRSTLLPLVYPDEENVIKPAQLEKERKLIQNAVFTDPNDQSAWFYQRWLFGLEKPSQALHYFMADRKHNCVMVKFAVPARLLQLELSVWKDGRELLLSWKTPGDTKASALWFAHVDLEAGSSLEMRWASGGGTFLDLREDFAISPSFNDAHADSLFSHHRRRALEGELESSRELQMLEPENKWVLLTIVHILHTLNGQLYEKEILTSLEQLESIDPLRKGYYLDLRSKILVENRLKSSEGLSVDLSNINLTCVHYEDFLSTFRKIDLRHNSLERINISKFINCEELYLDSNHFRSVEGYKDLKHLRVLSLAGNSHLSEEQIKISTAEPSL